MKKVIRFILKLPATPIVVTLCSFGYAVFSVFAFFQWVYDAAKFDKEVTNDCRNDMKKILKKWFTTI